MRRYIRNGNKNTNKLRMTRRWFLRCDKSTAPRTIRVVTSPEGGTTLKELYYNFEVPIQIFLGAITMAALTYQRDLRSDVGWIEYHPVSCEYNNEPLWFCSPKYFEIFSNFVRFFWCHTFHMNVTEGDNRPAGHDQPHAYT